MIPIKGYSTFDPLKHCVIGKNFSSDFFGNNIKNTKISDPLRRIADETEEDYQTLDKILKDAGVHTYRVNFDETIYDGNFHGRPPVCPRDHFATIGETFYATHPTDFYGSMLKQIDRKSLFLKNWDYNQCLASTAFISRCGKDLFWDRTVQDTNRPHNKNGKEECAKIIATLK